MAGRGPSSSGIIPLPATTAPSTSSPTTAATPTAASTSPATTTNGATSTPTSSSTSSSTATSATSAATSSSSSAALTSSSPLTTPQDTPGGLSTVTSTAFITATPTSQNTSTSHSFFSNTGAVAGVFSVVGIVVLGFVIALLINCVRRRRAQKFDRDVAEAAAEAAATPHSPFDDYSYTNPGGNGGGGGVGGGGGNGNGGGGGGYGYSDGSHGTYQLPPLAPPNPGEVYGMSEMSQYDPYAAGAASLAASAVGRPRSRKESEPGTSGIAGVGAGTLAREPSKRAPYHAFAGPQPHELQSGGGGTFRSRRSNQDVLEAAGLSGVPNVNTVNTLGSGAGGAYITRRTSETAQAVTRTNTSTLSGRSKFGSVSSGGHHPSTLQPGYPVESYYPQRNDSLSPDPFAGYPVMTVPPSKPLLNPYDGSGSGPGVASPTSLPGHLEEQEETSEAGSPTALRSDEHRMSYQDDADYSQGHRILRVANE